MRATRENSPDFALVVHVLHVVRVAPRPSRDAGDDHGLRGTLLRVEKVNPIFALDD